MGQGSDPITQLRALPPDEWPAFLRARSGLPGPRANLELADAFATIADRAQILQLAALDDEYLRFCGTEGLGRLIAEEPGDADLLTLLRERAGDPMWRTREGAARALQRVGDICPQQLRSIVAGWIAAPEAYVRRAAVAAICEPRLLSDDTMRAAALEACAAATRSITALPATARRSPDVRTLRRALGYCWSVAIAADPVPGLVALAHLRESDDPDVRWIVASNLTKARLRRVLPPDG